MKLKHLLTVALALSFGATGQVFAADYVIDTKDNHAFVTFKASHLGYSYIMGRFNNFKGSYTFDADSPSASSINVTIDAASLDTNHPERDKDLRSANFFDAGKYPTITFNSTSYEAGSGGTGSGSDAVLKGDLSMHGVTRSVAIDVKMLGEGKDPWGGYRSGFEGRVTVAADDYGLPGWVGDIEIYLSFEGVRQ